jgi:sirohydrochlorin cobaltochelatase
MNDTLLLIGHGSRHTAGNDEIERFAKKWRERRPGWRIEVCFIELAPVLMDAGLDRAAAVTPTGARVVVLPFILNAAGHVKMDIPQAVAAARLRHPATEFVCAPHLGLGRDIFAIVERRLDGLMRELAVPDPRTTGVVLLGRGSSDAGANGEMARLARWVFEAREHDLVDIAFTGITHPRLETVVQRQARLGMMQILVQPVYLFSGVLIERIGGQVERLRSAYPQISFALGSYFGFDAEIFALLDARALAAASGEQLLDCDGCDFRRAAAAGHAHHHHHGHGAAHACGAGCAHAHA